MVSASYPTLKFNGQEFVLVPRGEFRRLTAEDRRDARQIERAAALYRAGKMRTISHAKLKRSLGI
jgi:hypothetical protein